MFLTRLLIFYIMDKKLLAKIRQAGQHTDWNEAFGGKSKGNRHLERIVNLARFIAQREGADINIAQAGAWLHDTPLAKGSDYDLEKVRISAIEYINNLGIKDPNLTETLIACIVAHEGLVKTRSKEARVVHDADVLEKSGFLGIIRHTWKSTNLNIFDPERIDEKIVKTIFEHLRSRRKKLYFKTSKQLSQEFEAALKKAEKLDNIISVVKKIAHLASQGVITEKIAQSLKKDLPAQLHDSLMGQLNLEYLKRKTSRSSSVRS